MMKTEPPRVSKRHARAQRAPDAWDSDSIFSRETHWRRGQIGNCYWALTKFDRTIWLC